MTKASRSLYIFIIVILSFLVIETFYLESHICSTKYEMIHNQKVNVVDVMYTYELDGKLVKGDYSFVSKQGYEYTDDGSYTYEFKGE